MLINRLSRWGVALIKNAKTWVKYEVNTVRSDTFENVKKILVNKKVGN